MSRNVVSGMTLVELVVAMAIAAIAGTMIMQMVLAFQSRVLAEISRNDLQDRAERLIRFMASDIRDSSFQVGATPRAADGEQLALVHDSLPGNPLEILPYSLLAQDSPDGNDRLTFVKAISFAPPLYLVWQAFAGETSFVLNRLPNRAPGSTRELQPAPEAIDQLVLANHRDCYSVLLGEQELQFDPPLSEDVPAATEVMGVRATVYQLDPFAGSHRLRRDDFTSRDILDDAVDGLQFEYLLSDGSMVNQPEHPENIRGVRISLLVRDLRQDRNYSNTTVYTMGNQNYGPFGDHYRRCQVSRLVEVKNHGLQ